MFFFNLFHFPYIGFASHLIGLIFERDSLQGKIFMSYIPENTSTLLSYLNSMLEKHKNIHLKLFSFY